MEVRDRIVEAAGRLLAEGGREAVSTRAVSAAAGVQAPAIYRLFGDKQGLLDAVVARGFETYVGPKVERESAEDPVAELRRGWDLHLEFGLANPALYVLMVEPRGDGPPPASLAGIAHLRGLVERIAAVGRLAVPVEVAVQLIHATGVGATLALLGSGEHDLRVAELAREATVATITTDASAVTEPGPAAAALTLRARLGDVASLSGSEQALLGEWLDRIAASPPR